MSDKISHERLSADIESAWPTEDQVWDCIRLTFGEKIASQLSFKRWKDGIDVDYPTHEAMSLARQFFAMGFAAAQSTTPAQAEQVLPQLVEVTIKRMETLADCALGDRAYELECQAQMRLACDLLRQAYAAQPPVNKKTRCESCNLLEPCADPQCPNSLSRSSAATGDAVAWRVKNDYGHWIIIQDRALADTYRDIEKLDVQPLYLAVPQTVEVTKSSGCVFCDIGSQLHHDEAAGFHHVADGEAVPCTLSRPRVPKVRTSHHRNKEEAARLQALVDKKYASSPLSRPHRETP